MSETPTFPDHTEFPIPTDLTLDGFLSYRDDYGDVAATIAYTAALDLRHPFSHADVAQGWMLHEQRTIEKEYKHTAPHVTAASLPSNVKAPVLVFPSIDDDNPILATFFDVDEKACTIEMSIVWENEVLPKRYTETANYLYATARLAHWKRLADVEHVLLTYSANFAELQSVTFYSYSFNRTWYSPSIGGEKKETITGIASTDGHPMLYINTWNHEMGQANTSGEDELIQLAGYLMFKGSKSTADKWAKDVFAYARSSDVTWGSNFSVMSGETKVTTDGQPAVAFNGKDAMVVYPRDQALYFALIDPFNPKPEESAIGVTACKSGQVFSVHDGTFMVIFPSGTTAPGELQITGYDADSNKWSKPLTLPGASTSLTPAVCVSGAVVHVAWTSGTSIMYGALDQEFTWKVEPKAVPHCETSAGPALVVGPNGDINLYYRGNEHDAVYWRYRTDGDWVRQRKITRYRSSRSPAVAMLGPNAHLMCLGKDTGDDVYELTYAFASRGIWIPRQIDIDETSPHSPSLTRISDTQLLLAFCGGVKAYVDLKIGTLPT